MRYFIVIIAAVFLTSALALQNGNYNQGKKVWKAPKSADNLKNPFKDKTSSALDGEKIFVQSCASCHGKEGIGNGPAGISLNPKPANLTSKEAQEQSDGAIFWKISNGNGTMVAWKYSLSEKQRWHLVDYIRELGKKIK